jgi:nifR3 family TIM-barrel protein
MKIGKVLLRNGFILAPMAGFSTAPFRRLCVEFGAGLTTSEMVSSEAVLHRNVSTESACARAPGERPFAIQIVGSEPASIALAARSLEGGCDIIDVNLGCPACAVTGQGAGAALLDDPKRVVRIFDALSVLRVPYTAKLRLGFKTKASALEIAKAVERGGASALTVHGRTAKQGYNTPCDFAAIGEIKRALSIPVIGNGDVSSPETAERMMIETGCDGVMIGRAAIGNPFIFRQLNDYFSKGSYDIPTVKERADALVRFLRYAKDEPLPSVRLHAVQFVSGFEKAAEIRHRISRAKTLEEIKNTAEELGRRPAATAPPRRRSSSP